MARPQHRPLGRRIQARMMRVINVPMRVVLGLRVATPLSRRLMLVFLTGRKTGKSYRQPVSYVRQGTTLLTPGGGKWKLNLQEGRPERIRLRGRDVAWAGAFARWHALREALLECLFLRVDHDHVVAHAPLRFIAQRVLQRLGAARERVHDASAPRG